MTIGKPKTKVLTESQMPEPTTTVLDNKELPSSEMDKPQIKPHVEPMEPTGKAMHDDPMKSDCAYCKAEAIASLTLQFSVVVLILALAFKFLRTAKNPN